jgi:hypothetical protein
MRRLINIRLKVHQCHIHQERPYKSAVAKHSINLGHCTQLHNTYILTTENTSYMITSSGWQFSYNSIQQYKQEGWLLSPMQHSFPIYLLVEPGKKKQKANQ